MSTSVGTKSFQLLPLYLYCRDSLFLGDRKYKKFRSHQGYPGMMRSSLPHWSILGYEPCVPLFLLPLFPIMVLEASPVTTNDHGSLNLLEDRMFLIQSKFSFPFCSQLGILSQVLVGMLPFPPTVLSSLGVLAVNPPSVPWEPKRSPMRAFHCGTAKPQPVSGGAESFPDTRWSSQSLRL